MAPRALTQRFLATTTGDSANANPYQHQANAQKDSDASGCQHPLWMQADERDQAPNRRGNPEDDGECESNTAPLDRQAKKICEMPHPAPKSATIATGPAPAFA